MSNLLKNLYSPLFYQRLTLALEKSLPSFNKDEFLNGIYSDSFESMELKQRMRHTSTILHNFMPMEFSKGLEVIKETIAHLREKGIGEDGLAYMFIADYIEIYGIEDFETSVSALEFVTQFVSCEFAVRPFILRYGEQMISTMKKWSLHQNHKVRRLASEGSRPRLPWAMGIPFLKKDPSAILPILENLKNDSSDYVRRSVANSLNDIAKDHPGVVLKTAVDWSGISANTDAIIKHGSRTLLKQGHPEILKHYGLSDKGISITDFEVLTPQLSIGESLVFSFTIENQNIADQKVRLEYAVYYKKQNGQNTKKVFKISERIYPGQAKISVLRKQKFVPITTRRFYLGEHQLSLIINGIEKEILDFELISD